MKTVKIISTIIAMAIITKTTFALDAAQAARVDALFKNFDHPNAPGASVMVIHNGKSVFAKGYGLADLVTKTPCTTNTNFRLASVSKQFTAMAVLMLADRGKLKLDEKLTDFFPEFPSYGKQITVQQLLTHSSGLIEYDEIMPAGTTIPVLDQDVLRLLIEHTGDAPKADLHTVAWSENETENAAKLKVELQQRAASVKTNRPATYFPPGSEFRYSNSGYALLALIVEVRSGQTFARFLKENIFEPLKMTNTQAYEQGLSVVPNRAFGHSLASNVWVRTDQSLTSSVLGDGGIYSSLSDLFKWDQSLYKSKLVSERVLRAAFTPHSKSDRAGLSYGYGWFIGEYRGLKEISHNGSTIGFRNRIARFPEKHFTVIILSNRAGGEWNEFPHRIADIVLFDAGR
ncbi:MAG: class A beta-lactamase-related serine hydrolase [Pedosphaera sp.]|nr:class A beta-lactamase-related serine hydrolase [Pedosphaera sp.]